MTKEETKEKPKKDLKKDSVGDEISTLKEQLANSKEAQLRALADLENFRRRQSAEKIVWGDFAIGDFLANNLATFLELKLSAEHTKDEDVKKVVGKFFVNLDKNNLCTINPQSGEELDTNLHEVLLTEEGEKGKIVRTLEAGWKYKDKILQPAKVSVA